VQGLFDCDRAQCRIGEGLQRRDLRRFRRRQRQHPRILPQIERVLSDVKAEPLARQRPGRQFGVERQPVDRLPQPFILLPGFVGKPHHASHARPAFGCRCAIPISFTAAMLY
jgi:hypothetical protein